MMRILLIGNYPADRQESMLRYAALLERELLARGHSVRLLQPQAVLGGRSGSGFSKWLGYVDKFLLFPQTLQRTLADFDLVHICDHSNSMYIRSLGAKPNVVTCHDVLAIASALGEVRENAVTATGRKLQSMILAGLRAAQFVVCVSSHSQAEMLRVTGRRGTTSSVVLSGLSYPYSPMPQAEAAPRLQALGFDPAAPYFLHVGGAAWYKNRLGLLQIFDYLQRLPNYKTARLLLVGGALEPELDAYIAQHDLAAKVTRLSGLANEDLRAAYSLAQALIFPSLQEGFGWPILEAQACGCPVLTTNRAPMTEVGGSGAVYFDPAEPAAAAGIVANALRTREVLCREALANASLFSMDRMMDGCLRAYRHVLNPTQYN